MVIDQKRKLFEEIARWPIDARDESDPEYFIKFRGVSSIESGDICFVIGRKGSGKTAIAEYLNNKPCDLSKCRVLSFSNFPFNVLYSQKDLNFRSGSAYITIWKYVIYSAICNLMKDDGTVDEKCRNDLKKVFDLDFDVALGRSIEKITGKTFGASLAGYGITMGETRANIQEITLDDRVHALENLIKDFAGDCEYFIVFDSLDDDYSHIFEQDSNFDEYKNLLTSLFKAVLNVKDVFKKTDVKIRPIVLLRDDIFSLLNSNDKNKWNDKLITLNWNKTTLRSLIVGRMEIAMRAISDDLPDTISDQEILDQLFTQSEYVYTVRGRLRRVDIVEYMIRSTLLRPRDIIIFIRELAKYLKSENLQVGFVKEIKEAEHSYSDYLRQELENELHPIIPEIRKILDSIAKLRKDIFNKSELHEKLKLVGLYHSEDVGVTFTNMIAILYRFGIIGNITKNGAYRMFSFDSNRKDIDLEESLCVHRGLIRSLHVANTPNLLAAEE